MWSRLCYIITPPRPPLFSPPPPALPLDMHISQGYLSVVGMYVTVSHWAQFCGVCRRVHRELPTMEAPEPRAGSGVPRGRQGMFTTRYPAAGLFTRGNV